MASALALQCSTNWAIKTHQLGADQFVEFILTRKRNETQNEDDMNCENTNFNENTMVALCLWVEYPQKFWLLAFIDFISININSQQEQVAFKLLSAKPN